MSQTNLLTETNTFHSLLLLTTQQKQASTQETPFFLFFGREPIMPNDIKINRRYETYEDTSMVYSQQWEKAQKLAREHLFKSQTRQKKYYDVTTKIIKYNIGD